MSRKKTQNRFLARMGMFFILVALALLAIGPVLLKTRKIPFPAEIKNLRIDGLKEISMTDLSSLLLNLKKRTDRLVGWSEEMKANLGAHPRVATATVARTLTGGLFVQVAERKTSALLNTDRLYAVDADGNILGAVKSRKKESQDLIVITGPWNKKTASDEVQLKIREALELKKAFVAAGFEEKKISELHYDVRKGWVAYRVGMPITFVMGQSDFETKAVRLKRVMSDFQGREQNIKEIDLDFDDRVIVKLSG